jgi:hypothetical protein
VSDLIETGMQWLGEQRRTRLGRSVTYYRGGQSVVVTASLGRQSWEIERDDALRERFETRDYLIDRAELVLGGAPIVPRRGDRITEDDGGTTLTYEVTSPAGEPVFELDAYRLTYRIHTQQVPTPP